MEDYYKQITENSLFNPSSKLKEALEYATELHKDQKRHSGEPYIIHPVIAAVELAKIGLDETSVIAALLHDVIEDCGVTEDDLKKRFGPIVAKLVVAETKVDEMTSESHLKFTDYEALKKLLISMTDDIRVLLIRLADRLHNMRTIQYLKPERQITYAQETLNVYVPLAEYIGMGIWRRELEDISFRIISPEKYEELSSMINSDPRSTPKYIENIEKNLEKILNDNHIKATVSGRVKSVSSTYKKLQRKIKSGEIASYDLKYVKDILAFSIVTKNNNVIECYKVLGLIHGKWPFSQVDFSDYISNPKPNGYRSIHTVISYDENIQIEVQIKTNEMHEFNEFGPASHIAYKMQNRRNAAPTKIFSWIKNLVRWKDQIDESKFQLDIFRNRIYVFTPQGKVIELPKDSTPVDFAYHIHTRIGDSCKSAKINLKFEPLNFKLKTGDIVEIITDKKQITPKKEWLQFVKSGTARSAIKKGLNDENSVEILEKGKQIMIEKAKERYGLNWSKLSTEDIERMEVNLKMSLESIYRKVYSRPSESLKILSELEPFLKIKPIESLTRPKREKADDEDPRHVGFKFGESYQYRFAKCCNPEKPEPITAFVSRGFGVAIHSEKCKEIKKRDQKEAIFVRWL